MKYIDSTTLDWEKMGELIPAIVQHAESGEVLMLCYMDKQSLEITQVTDKLTLFSRSKQRLWRKGETSGNTMDVRSITADCDGDSLLVQVIPTGPACHLGFNTCYQTKATPKISFLATLAAVIRERADNPNNCSYTTELMQAGVSRCAQKVGEEATETVIAAVKNDRDELIQETADLVFHLLILLQVCEVNLYEVIDCLQKRHLQPVDVS